jgi:hypothetical protein
VDAQRRAFLADVEADLTTSSVAPAVDGGYRKRRAGKLGAIATAALAGASFFAFSATAASASVSPATGNSVASPALADCFTPNHVPYSHTKDCEGVTYINWSYLYTYSPDGGIVICYEFNGYFNSPCGGGPVGDASSCERP